MGVLIGDAAQPALMLGFGVFRLGARTVVEYEGAMPQGQRVSGDQTELKVSIWRTRRTSARSTP
jgi:hypothetical protein